METNFEEYMENSNKIMEGLITAQNNSNMMIKKVKKDALTKSSDIIDTLKNDFATIKHNYELLNNKFEESNIKILKTTTILEEKLDVVENKVVKIEKFSETLRNHPTENREIRKLANGLVYSRFTKASKTVKDQLFHGIITDRCYKNIFKRLEKKNDIKIGSLLDINIKDINDVILYIKEWFVNDFNIKYAVDAELLECLKNIDGANESRYLLAQKYLEMTDGGVFHAI